MVKVGCCQRTALKKEPHFMSGEFNVNELTVKREAEFKNSWRMAGKPVDGMVHVYSMEDGNLPPDNTGIFYVNVPDESEVDENIIVKPEAAPDRDKLLPVERRAITFMPADMPPHADKFYCKVNLADPTGMKNKIGIRHEYRRYLPKWMSHFSRRMYEKDDVKSTLGTDGGALVVVVEPDDHERMIKLFIATRAWPLLTRFIMPV